MQTSLQLYINDELVDLGEDTSIQLTFQINDLADVKNQNGNTSNQFNLPLTQTNRRILGYPDEVYIESDAPYRRYNAKVVQDGIETIPAGYAELNRIDNKTAQITVLSGNVDFFDAIDGQIYDMGDSTSRWSDYGRKLVWAPYDHAWTVANVAGSQKKTDGWIWPIIDYGAISDLNYLTDPVNVRLQRPAFFLHTAIELLVKAADYRIDYERSSMMRDPLYQKLLIPFSNSDFEHGTDWQNTPSSQGLITVKSTNQIISNPRVTVDPNTGFPFEGPINFNQSRYIATENIQLTATVKFNAYLRGRFTGTPSELQVFFQVKSGGIFSNYGLITIQMDENYNRLGGSGSSIIGEQSFVNQKLTYEFELAAGDELFVKYHINNVGQNFGDTYAIIYQGAQFLIEPIQKNVLYKQQLQCERILPDLSQKAILKDALQHFGVICQSDNVTKKIIFASFKDVINNIPNALDWSEKMVDHGRQIYFKLGDYSQQNYMRYTQDESVPVTDMPKYFADDVINIDDETLTNKREQELFVSPYAPSINRPYIGGTIAQILKIDPEGEPGKFSISTTPRLLVDQKYKLKQNADGTTQSVRFTDVDGGGGPDDIVVNDVISIPYFFKADGEYNLCWCDKDGQQGLRSKYYPEVEHILHRSKKIVRYFILTPRDIQELDFLIPVYIRQEGAYFYINKIENWQKGIPCKVELVRL